MAACVKEEENASGYRQRKREAEEADKVEVAPGVTVASLRHFRAALIGPTQGLPKRRRLCLQKNLRWYAFGYVCVVITYSKSMYQAVEVANPLAVS